MGLYIGLGLGFWSGASKIYTHTCTGCVQKGWIKVISKTKSGLAGSICEVLCALSDMVSASPLEAKHLKSLLRHSTCCDRQAQSTACSM